MLNRIVKGRVSKPNLAAKESEKPSLSPAKYNPKFEFLHKKSPVAIIKPHRISSPHNSGSLNKYIEVFVSNVVESNKRNEKSVKRILDTLEKDKSEKKEKSKSDLNSSIIHSMSKHMNHAVETHKKIKEKDNNDSFYVEASDINSIAFNTAPVEGNYKMRSPFVSKTERYPEIKQSPGPGSYDTYKIADQSNNSDIKISPQAFGSTYRNRTHFLN
jgi:hypothetical protein